LIADDGFQMKRRKKRRKAAEWEMDCFLKSR